MVSEGILDQVLYFKVTNFIPTLSDAHCKLEWTMSAKFVSQQKIDNTFVYTLHLFKEDFAAENRISESSAATPSTGISVPSIVFEMKFLSLPCISVVHNANRNFSDQIEKDQRGSVVDPPSWVSHFEKLNQVKDEFKERLKKLSRGNFE
jgi:hypothetical protein